MQRNKNIAYDADDLDDDYDDYDDEQPEYTSEDLSNFASLTPVVRAALQEEGLSASQREIEEGLWESYWDVGEAVGYVRGLVRTKESKSGSSQGKKEKAGSKFDEAAKRSQGSGTGGGGGGGELIRFPSSFGGEDGHEKEGVRALMGGKGRDSWRRRGGSCTSR